MVVPGLSGLSGGIVPEQVAGLAVLATILAFPAGWAALGVNTLRVNGLDAPQRPGAAS